MSGIEHASNQSIKPFKSSEEYLYAMKEDLAEWLGDLYNIEIHVDNVLDVLETGALLCAHANNVTRVADEFQRTLGAAEMLLPASGVTFVSSAHPTTFLARDNVSNFINWCRKEMCVPDVLMFETDDLVLRKNEKNFVLCLLEVARRASRFGMSSPVLIQLEREIEEEIRGETEETILPKTQRHSTDGQNLDEMVEFLISRCTCPSQFPMVKVSEGKYRVGESNTLIFVRILRNHVMVRVGGGWDTLEHYLDKHDPCRCTSLIHKLTQRPVTPVHEIKERLTTSQSDGLCGSQTTLLLSRSQSPLQSVVRSPSSPYRRGGPSPHRSSFSPDPEHQPRRRRDSPSPNKLRERQRMQSNLHTCTDSKEVWIADSFGRKGREATRSSPTPRLSSSLPRSSLCPTTPQPEIKRSQSPLVLQRNPNQIQPQKSPEKSLGQTWTKSHFVSKLRQNSSSGVKGREIQDNTPLNSSGKDTVQPSWLPKPPNIFIQETEDNGVVRTFSPSKGVTEKQPMRPRTPTKENQGQRSAQFQDTMNSFLDSNEKNKFGKRGNREVNKGQTLTRPVPNMVPPSHINISSNPYKSVNLKCKTDLGGEGEQRNFLYTPSPLSPVQEANIYKSLEEEILSNIQQLSFDSDTNSSSDENFLEIPHRSSDHFKVSSLKKYENQKAGLNSTAKPDSGREASFAAVLAELSIAQRKIEKVSVEKWVTTLPTDLRDKVKEDEAASSNTKASKPSVISSWSSLGSSMDSKKTGELVKVSQIVKRKNGDGKESSEYPQKQSSSLKQRRSLKQPERVPSIYKLKLRSCVRPRRDHRTDRKPSKIPKPVFYEKISCKEGSHGQKENGWPNEIFCSENLDYTRTLENTWTKPKSRSQIQSAKKCQRINQESHANRDVESWV